MIRIEELPSGVLEVHAKDVQRYTAPELMDETIRTKYELLRATDVHTRIDGVGWHVETRTYWIFEPTDDIKYIDNKTTYLLVVLKRPMCHIEKVFFNWLKRRGNTDGKS